MRYTYTTAGLEQDVILFTAPKPPESYGLDPDSTRLEVLTEFVRSPSVRKASRLIKRQADEYLRAQMQEPDLRDELIDFGPMVMTAGRCIRLKEGWNFNPLNKPPGSLPVAKQWVRIQERQFLIESVEVRGLQPNGQKLPETRPGGKTRACVPRDTLLARLPSLRPPGTTKATVRVAQAAYAPENALLLDYLMVHATGDFLFQGDRTYHVTGPFYIGGATTLEGGTVVKFDPANLSRAQGGSVIVQGPVVCSTDPKAQATFTAKDDNTLGARVRGATGKPEGDYGHWMLQVWTPDQGTDLRYLGFRHAFLALGYYGSKETHHLLRDCVFADSQVGMHLDTASVAADRVQTRRVSLPDYVLPDAALSVDGRKRDDILTEAPEAGQPGISSNASAVATMDYVSLGEAVDYSSATWSTSGNASWFGQTSGGYGGGDSAQSGDIGDTQSSSMETTLTGPGTLTFYWMVQSEMYYDFLRFYIDGVQQAEMAGLKDYEFKSYALTSGSHTLRWTYSKDGSTSTGLDAGMVDQVTFTPSGGGGTVTLGEAVDNTNLSWSTGGSASWIGQQTTSYSGGDAAQSGLIAHSQSTYLQTAVNGPGTLTFYWKVSSESGYDFLRFYIDGVQQPNPISGSVDWTWQSYSIGSGSHTVKWEYSKDGSVNSGSDAGWVDGVAFSGSTPTVATPTISPNGGTYSSSVSVTLSTTTSGASIYYTTDGSEPTTSSSYYSGALTISASCALKAKAFASGYNPSATASAPFTISQSTVSTPTISPYGGTYSSSVSVTLSTTTSGASIYYTTNGSEPTQSSTLYTGPFAISASCALKAKAFASGYNPSATASAAFTITTTGTLEDAVDTTRMP